MLKKKLSNLIKFKNKKFCFTEITKFLDELSNESKRKQKEKIIKNYIKNETKRERILDIAKIISKNYMIEKEAFLSYKLIQDAYEDGLMNMDRMNIRWEELMARINKIKNTTGINSQDQKQEQLLEIFSRKLSSRDMKLVKDILLNNVRVGAGVKTFYKCFMNEEELIEIEKIFRRKLDENIIEPFYTISPMLAQNAVDIKDLEKKLSKVNDQILVEQKYDGTRIQIHFDKQNGCKIFSRSLEDITDKYKFISQQINMSCYVNQKAKWN